MAAPHSVDPAQLAEQLASASPDVLREMVTVMANALMSAQADQLCGADYGERSPERTNRRNGYRTREWDTRAGTVELAVPKLRQGSYFPEWLLTQVAPSSIADNDDYVADQQQVRSNASGHGQGG